jgi:translation elongation factor P/translation initiation factor 5A
MTRMDSQLENLETAVYVFEERLNIMDTMDLETSQQKSEAVGEEEDALKEEATMETIRALGD